MSDGHYILHLLQNYFIFGFGTTNIIFTFGNSLVECIQLGDFCQVYLIFQVNVLDGLGQTALHRVGQQGNMQACRLLMSYAVDSSIVSVQGYTAAQLATENIQKLLRGLSCDVDIDVFVRNLRNVL